MKHIVSFSGGVASFFTAKAVIDKYGKENAVLVFCDTLTEDEDLYRFIEDAKKYFNGVEFVRLCEGRNIWQCAFDENFIFNSMVANCTVNLKRKMFSQYRSQYKPEDCIIYLGFTADEMHRAIKSKELNKPWQYEFPLLDDIFLHKEQMIYDLEHEIGIKKPRLYNWANHNNCGGFCFKAGIGHFKQLYQNMPERYKYHEEMEQKLIKQVKETRGYYATILRRHKDGEKIYVSLRELRETEFGNLCEEDAYSYGGCNCFVD